MSPVIRENTITKAIYRTKRFIPSTIFNAPRFVIFVAGPVIINAAALPMLIPETSHCCKSGIVPVSYTQSGTPMVAAISTPNPSLLFPKSSAKPSAGTYLWNNAESSTPIRK